MKFESQQQSGEEKKDVVVAPYAGPTPLSAAMGRGSFLGIVGYGIGRVIGDLGMPAREAANYSRNGAHTVGGLLAVTGAILGAYTAMRDAQAAARQHYVLQKQVMAPESLVEKAQELGVVSAVQEAGRNV